MPTNILILSHPLPSILGRPPLASAPALAAAVEPADDLLAPTGSVPCTGAATLSTAHSLLSPPSSPSPLLPLPPSHSSHHPLPPPAAPPCSISPEPGSTDLTGEGTGLEAVTPSHTQTPKPSLTPAQPAFTPSLSTLSPPRHQALTTHQCATRPDSDTETPRAALDPCGSAEPLCASFLDALHSPPHPAPLKPKAPAPRLFILPNACFRCLSTGHHIRDCRDPIKCRKCGASSHPEHLCRSASLPPRCPTPWPMATRPSRPLPLSTPPFEFASLEFTPLLKHLASLPPPARPSGFTPPPPVHGSSA